MKLTLILACLAFTARADMPAGYDVKLADVIYKIEGGAKTRWPYGVKSVKASNPRQVTLNSIRNNWRRWEQAGKPGEFVQFMAARWCPVESDPIGNRNWVANARKLMQ
jgi:hypothetical protein